MQVKTRKEAILSGENTYFTGKQCRNGHISYRYVQSGSCAECINLNRPQSSINPTARDERLNNMAALIRVQDVVKNEKAEAVRLFKERKAIVENDMVLIKLRLFIEHRAELALIAYGLAAMREPRLMPEDVHPSSKPLGSMQAGTALFQFYCYAEDAETLRKAMTDSQSRFMPDVKTERLRIFGTEEQANFITPPSDIPIPDWDIPLKKPRKKKS